MQKRWTWFIALALIIGLLAGCSNNDGNSGSSASPSASAGGDASGSPSASPSAAAGEAKEGGTLIVGLSGDPLSFNPDGTGDDFMYPIAQNVFNRLVKINNKQQIIPDLAESWEVTDDGLQYTFRLHSGVKWHDGQAFTSKDVKFTLEAIKSNSGFASTFLAGIADIATPDDNTVVVKLSKPDAAFIGYLAWYGTFILPEHVYGSNWAGGTGTNPIGTGPFKFDGYKAGVSVNLVKNPDYFAQVPHVDKLIFSIITDPNTMVQAFYNGEIDILGGDPPASELDAMMNDSKVRVVTSLWPSRVYLLFNFDREPFNKPEVRQAIAYALNNDEIVAKAQKGQAQVAKTFLSPVYDWAVSGDYAVPATDVDKAKQLLEQAGLKPDKDGNYLSATLDIFEYNVYQDIATVIKDQLAKAGIKITINVSDYAAWEASVSTDRKYDLSILGGYQGPDVGAVKSRVGTGGPSNMMGYSNPALDRLLEEGATLVKEEERKAKYTEIQKILSEDLPIVPISEYVGSNPVQSYVRGEPGSEEAVGHTAFNEYSYVWLDK